MSALLSLPKDVRERLKNTLSPVLFDLLDMRPTDVERALRRLGTDKVANLLHNWEFWARKDQFWNPGDEKTTFACTGRGWGKTRFGSETTHRVARYFSHICGGRMVLIGRTAADVRDVMVQGESGIMNTGDPNWRPVYEPSKRLLTWPNGVTAVLRSGEEPAQVRGLNVGFAWLDEYAFFQYPQTTLDNLHLALRIGTNPKIIVTSTPLPTAHVRALYDDPTTRVITGSTFDNQTNLARQMVGDMRRRFGGTRLGDQELHGLILQTNDNAIWRQDWIRRVELYELPTLVRIVVGVDPAGGDQADNTKKKRDENKTPDETGIVVAGICDRGNLWTLDDVSCHASSAIWAKEVVRAAVRWEASTIVGEVNFGGDMVRTVVQNEPLYHEAGLKFEMVRAKEGKAGRAEPVAALYEQGRAFHVGPPRKFTALEHQMVSFDKTLPRSAQKSPDRMDALVHAARSLIGEEGLDVGRADGKRYKSIWQEVAKARRARPPLR